MRGASVASSWVKARYRTIGVTVTLGGVYSDTTQLNSTDPVEQSCFCLCRHDLQTESTGSLRSLIGDSCSRCKRVDNSTSSWVDLCRYKHPFSCLQSNWDSYRRISRDKWSSGTQRYSRTYSTAEITPHLGVWCQFSHFLIAVIRPNIPMSPILDVRRYRLCRYRYDIDISKNRYLQCQYDIDTDISISSKLIIVG